MIRRILDLLFTRKSPFKSPLLPLFYGGGELSTTYWEFFFSEKVFTYIITLFTIHILNKLFNKSSQLNN
ncbi:MAG: hypothetical protein A2035_05520 [Nitrospirae bacterium GWA2_42_11]|nr:MAG: hypothetical protein A2035_05520 [Nitrospirae bacterium GWA2_42_11]